MSVELTDAEAVKLYSGIRLLGSFVRYVRDTRSLPFTEDNFEDKTFQSISTAMRNMALDISGPLAHRIWKEQRLTEKEENNE